MVNHSGSGVSLKKTNSHFLSNHEHAANKKLTHVEHQHRRTTQTCRYFCDPAALRCSNQQRRSPSVRGRKLEGRSAFWRSKEREVGVGPSLHLPIREGNRPSAAGRNSPVSYRRGRPWTGADPRRSGGGTWRTTAARARGRGGRRLIGSARGSTALEAEKDVTTDEEVGRF